jgi:hypothetical protein
MFTRKLPGVVHTVVYHNSNLGGSGRTTVRKIVLNEFLYHFFKSYYQQPLKQKSKINNEAFWNSTESSLLKL